MPDHKVIGACKMVFYPKSFKVHESESNSNAISDSTNKLFCYLLIFLALSFYILYIMEIVALYVDYLNIIAIQF